MIFVGAINIFNGGSCKLKEKLMQFTFNPAPVPSLVYRCACDFFLFCTPSFRLTFCCLSSAPQQNLHVHFCLSVENTGEQWCHPCEWVREKEMERNNMPMCWRKCVCHLICPAKSCCVFRYNTFVKIKGFSYSHLIQDFYHKIRFRCSDLRLSLAAAIRDSKQW